MYSGARGVGNVHFHPILTCSVPPLTCQSSRIGCSKCRWSVGGCGACRQQQQGKTPAASPLRGGRGAPPSPLRGRSGAAPSPPAPSPAHSSPPAARMQRDATPSGLPGFTGKHGSDHSQMLLSFTGMWACVPLMSWGPHMPPPIHCHTLRAQDPESRRQPAISPSPPSIAPHRAQDPESQGSQPRRLRRPLLHLHGLRQALNQAGVCTR